MKFIYSLIIIAVVVPFGLIISVTLLADHLIVKFKIYATVAEKVNKIRDAITKAKRTWL